MILFATDLYKAQEHPDLGYCPHCFGLVWIVRTHEDEIREENIENIRRHRNRTQIKILLAYCEENGIRVSEEEKKAA